MRIKDIKPKFEFVGEFKEVRDVLNKDNEICGHDLVILDKEMGSEVAIKIWSGSEAKYWDLSDKKMVTVTSNVQETMNRVKANGTGIPLSITLVGKSTQEIYTNNEFLEIVKKIRKGQLIKVEGSVNYRTYKNKVQRDYSIRRFQLVSGKPEIGFRITNPMVLYMGDKDLFSVKEYNHTVPMLVRAKLESGNYGYRSVSLAINKDYIISGMAKDQPAESVNNIIQNVFIGSEGCEYYIMNITGRLKTGAITRKPTEEDLNPMKVALLKMKGGDALKEALSSMDEISTYFDDIVLDLVELVDGKFGEKINKSDLNLEGNEVVSTKDSNPLFAAMSQIINKQPVEEDKKTIEVVKEEVVVEEEKADDSVSKLEKLVNEEESTIEEIEEETEESDDEFPF